MMVKCPPMGQCSAICKQSSLHRCLGGKSDGYDYNEQYQCHADAGAVE